MVEEAFSSALNKTITEREFIKYVKNKTLSVGTQLNCIDPNCKVELDPLGKNIVANGKTPKYLGFIIKHRNNPHSPACKYVSKADFIKGINESVSTIKQLIINKNTITLIGHPKKQKSSQGVTSVPTTNNNQNNIVKNNSNAHHYGNINKNTNISNLGTLVNLFLDPSIDNNTTYINVALNIPKVNGTTTTRTLDDLFFNLDDDNTGVIHKNKFFIFYGQASSKDFSNNGLAIEFQNKNLSVPTNKLKLRESIIGKEILKNKNTNKVIYFEGYLDDNNKASKFEDTFANCLFIEL